jgi:hypothetical protein
MPQVDRLAIIIHQEAQEQRLRDEATKLQESSLKRKKKEASNFLAPPPASLLEARPISSALKLTNTNKINEVAVISAAKLHNNLHSDFFTVDVDEGKENLCPTSIKKHRTTVAGTDLFGMFTSAMKQTDPTMTALTTMMEQRNKLLELAEQRRIDAEERALRNEERSQHLQLLQLLRAGTIDQQTYEALKP